MSAKRPSTSSEETLAKRSRNEPLSLPPPAQTGKVNPVQLTDGAKWMLQQLDRMAEEYKKALYAAALIIQYQSFAKRSRLNKTIPQHLQKQLKSSWGAYDLTRRHVEHYMAQASAHAANPANPQSIVIAQTAPQALQPISVPVEQPSASPIPLSAATLVSFPPTIANEPTITNVTVPPVINSVPDQGSTGFPSTFDMFPSANAASSTGGDLSGVGMAELTAMMDSYNEGQMIQAGGSRGGVSNETNDLLASLSQQPPTQPLLQSSAQTIQKLQTEQEVDSILASLTGQPQTQISTQLQNQIPEPNQNPTLSQPTQPEFNFDFSQSLNNGDLDLSSLTGLFPTPGESGQANTINTDPVSTLKQGEANLDEILRDSSGFGGGVTLSSGTDQVFGDASEGMGLGFGNGGGGEYYDGGGGIDLDDFNFGDGSMPNIGEEEFESLFAELN